MIPDTRSELTQLDDWSVVKFYHHLFKFAPYILSAITHLLVVFILWFQFDFTQKPKPPKQHKPIIQTQTVSKQSITEQIKHYQEKQNEKQQKAIEQKQKIEQEKRQKEIALKKAEEKEKKKKETERKKRLAEKKKKEEARKKKLAEEKKRKAEEALLQKKMAEEQTALKQAERATEIERYKNYIQTKVQQNWFRPKMYKVYSCVITVELYADGSVADVHIKKSSGNKIFDNSVINAAYRSGPFDLPKDDQVKKELLKITMTFRNEN